MFENIMNFFKNLSKKNEKTVNNSKEAAKERLHLVLMQDRANVSADFLELMKQEIIDVIKKYIDVDETAIDVRMTNKENADGTNGAPALYANIPILNIKNEARKVEDQKASEKIEKEENAKKVEEKKEKNNEEIEENKEKENKEKEDKEEKEITNQEEKKEIKNKKIEKVKEKVSETNEEIKSEN